MGFYVTSPCLHLWKRVKSRWRMVWGFTLHRPVLTCGKGGKVGGVWCGVLRYITLSSLVEKGEK